MAEKSSRLVKNPSMSREKGKGRRENSGISARWTGYPFSLLPSPLSVARFGVLLVPWIGDF
jgi:hypothetical protein